VDSGCNNRVRPAEHAIFLPFAGETRKGILGDPYSREILYIISFPISALRGRSLMTRKEVDLTHISVDKRGHFRFHVSKKAAMELSLKDKENFKVLVDKSKGEIIFQLQPE
jgi:hypothetical protein